MKLFQGQPLKYSEVSYLNWSISSALK